MTVHLVRDATRVCRVRVCDRCGHVGNPENTNDYRKKKSLRKLKMAARIGTPDRAGREFHMASMATDIMDRDGLDVLVYGAGRSFDNHHIARLSQVREVVIADVMKLRDDAEFIDANEPASRKFRLVIACEVIEHFLSPREEFANLFRHVERGGLLVCSTNVYDGGDLSKQRYLFRGGHTSYYTPEALAIIARDNGYYIDFRLPKGAVPRKRYVLFTKSRDLMTRTACYFGRRAYAPAEDRPAASAG